MKNFITGQSAKIAHEGLQSSLKTRDAAQQCAVLWFEEILNRKLYRELGYSSINQYAQVELGFSKSHTGEFLALCRTFKRLPKVKKKVEEGKLPYTSARVLAPVMDETNQDEWLALSEKKSRRELAQEVKRARLDAMHQSVGQPSLMPTPVQKRPAAVVPVRVNMVMTPTQFARYEKLWEKVRKNRDVARDKVEALLEIMESFASGEPKRSARADFCVTRPPVQINIHQCPDCAKATVQTAKGELEIGTAELEHAQCLAQTSEPNKRNTTAIPPSVRRKAFAKARHQCQSVGCEHTSYLEVHHIVPRSKGGTNEPTNLQVLCSACHRMRHYAKMPAMNFQVKSPTGVYTWQPTFPTRHYESQ